VKRALLAIALVAAPAWAVDTCVECHLEQKDAGLSRQVAEVATDVHGRAGLSCHSCHGGDPAAGADGDYTESMDPKKGYIGIPKISELASFCTKCHADAKFMRDHNPRLPVDQLAKYSISAHAHSAAKDQKGAASCTACHRAHGIHPPSDTRSSVNALKVPETCGRCHADARLMAQFNLPSDTVAEYLQSVHWQAAKTRNDRSAPVCHDCHGNHATAAPAPAAIPALCGRCHSAEYATFSTGPHSRAQFFSGCEECHSNHRVLRASDALLGPTGLCYKCHQSAGKEQDDRARAEARELYATFTQLDEEIGRVTAMLEPLSRRAVPIADLEEDLRGAREKLVGARRLVHTDDLPSIRKAAAEGATAVARVRTVATTRLQGLSTRRAGGLAFAVLALLTAMTLAVKVRSLVAESGEA